MFLVLLLFDILILLLLFLWFFLRLFFFHLFYNSFLSWVLKLLTILWTGLLIIVLQSIVLLIFYFYVAFTSEIIVFIETVFVLILPTLIFLYIKQSLLLMLFRIFEVRIILRLRSLILSNIKLLFCKSETCWSNLTLMEGRMEKMRSILEIVRFLLCQLISLVL